MRIDRKNKQVEIKDLVNNKLYFEKYDKLVLSPGANPIKPNMPGINSKRVYTLRTVPDTVEIRSYVDKL